VSPCNVAVGYQCFRQPCCLHHPLQPEDEGNKFLRNVGVLWQRCTASQPRRL